MPVYVCIDVTAAATASAAAWCDNRVTATKLSSREVSHTRSGLLAMADKSKSGASAIEIFLRVRPHKGKRHYELEEHDVLDKSGVRKVKFLMQKDLSADVINNHHEEYNFKFGEVFDQDARQEDVFDRVAVAAVQNALDGYNSTVFAYGQTGSGKTFTITGGAERYNDRGVIPRALSKIFAECNGRHDRQYQVYVSYLEIYNESGYDLLDQSKETQKLEDLPRVTMQEDEDGNVHMKGLSANLASNEEEALNLLFVGDTNRMIAETPMNMASSRSHCIFTVTIESRAMGSDAIRRSKFNLVDLAGSERVHKTHADGNLLREAKYINLSLHYLEQCIVSLSEKRGHIPYRNSMMTAVLRDSLGGNCKTAMIATVSAELRNLDEAISTCRFAQRVAMVKNEATINESLDPQLMIRRLKQENRELREEIAMLQGEAVDRGDEAMGEDEMARLRDLINAYISDPEQDAKLSINDFAKIRAAFALFKEIVNARPQSSVASVSVEGGSGGTTMAAVNEGDGADGSQIETLKLQLQQRDNEINILVAMLNKRNASSGGDASSAGFASSATGAGVAARGRVGGGEASAAHAGGSPHLEPEPEPQPGPAVALHRLDGSDTSDTDALVNTDMLRDRNQAFEHFRKSYRKNEAIEENKAILKEKYASAKAMAAKVNAARQQINFLKSTIEQLRKERAMQGVVEGEGVQEEDPEEERAKSQIEVQKEAYKRGYASLKSLKAEIEHLQLMLEKSRKGLQKDFEQWFVRVAQQCVAREKAEAVREQRGGKGKGAALQGSHLELETPRTAHARMAAGPMITGNVQADADIIAFYKAREELMSKKAA